MAIEAQQFTQKDELIAKFYTLRAGLSAIAEETQKIRSVENDVINLQRKDRLHQQEIKSQFDEENRRISKIQAQINNEINVSEYYLNSKKTELSCAKSKLTELKLPKAYKKYDAKLGCGFSFLVALAVFIVLLLTAQIPSHTLGYVDDITTDAGVIFIIRMGIIILPFVITIVFGIIFASLLRIIPKKKALKIDISNYESKINQLENEVHNCQVNTDYLKNQTSITTNKYQDQLDVSIYEQEIRQLQNHLKNEIIPVHTTNSKAIKAALHKEFDSLLTESDWQNVDLLIFYLNTGRADSLKEALLLVDQQRQTDQIAHAITAASQHIASTIHENTYRLATVMTRCASQLSNQINNNHISMMAELHRNTNAIDNLNQGIANIGVHIDSLNRNINSLENSIITQTSAIINAEQLNASLLTQANQSSDRLIQELRYNQRYWVK